MKRFSYFYFIGALFVIGYGFRVSPLYLFNPKVLVFVLIPSIFLLLTHYSPVEMKNAFKMAFKKNKGTEAEVKNAFLFFRSAQNIFLMIAALGILAAFIRLIFGVPAIVPIPQDPAPHALGRILFADTIVHSILTIFYPVLLMVLVFLPFKSALQKKINDGK